MGTACALGARLRRRPASRTWEVCAVRLWVPTLNTPAGGSGPGGSHDGGESFLWWLALDGDGRRAEALPAVQAGVFSLRFSLPPSSLTVGCLLTLYLSLADPT